MSIATLLRCGLLPVVVILALECAAQEQTGGSGPRSQDHSQSADQSKKDATAPYTVEPQPGSTAPPTSGPRLPDAQRQSPDAVGARTSTDQPGSKTTSTDLPLPPPTTPPHPPQPKTPPVVVHSEPI